MLTKQETMYEKLDGARIVLSHENNCFLSVTLVLINDIMCILYIGLNDFLLDFTLLLALN